MTPIEKLNNQQLSERNKFDAEKAQERDILNRKQLNELAQQGPSIDLDNKHRAEQISLQEKQSREGQILYERHLKEDKELRELLAKIQPLKNHEAQQDIKALNVRYAEERDNTKRNAEAYQGEDRQSLLDKMKERWNKNKDQERDR